MSVARVTEIIASSPKSFDDAIKEGVKRATKTIDNVVSVWVKDQSVYIKDNEIAEYKVAMKVTFVVK